MIVPSMAYVVSVEKAAAAAAGIYEESQSAVTGLAVWVGACLFVARVFIA